MLLPMPDPTYPPTDPAPPRRVRQTPNITLYTPDGQVIGPPPAVSRPTIKELPEDDRPREKLERLGPAALSDAELLAILLRMGRQGETAVEQAGRLLRE